VPSRQPALILTELHRPKSGEGTYPLKAATQIREALRGFIRDEGGQNLIEYALVAGLIGLAAVTAMSGLSTKIKQALNTVGNNLSNAI
jgi:pilus assembly protein Flp/PilA